jgi:hypothetical protein
VVIVGPFNAGKTITTLMLFIRCVAMVLPP